jgi:spore germination protein GerM
MHRRSLVTVAIVALAAAIGWMLFVALPRWYGARPVQSATPAVTQSQQPPAPSPSGAARKITATLFYVSPDGMTLTGMQKEVAFADGVAPQARAIVEAQLAPSPPLVSAVPAETKLRDVFVTDRGDAFVDLSSEVSTRHSGGALDELLTIYTIVNALTVNLPAIGRVQILIDGKEVDTLAGHADLRHPLTKSLQWVVTHDTQ